MNCCFQTRRILICNIKLIVLFSIVSFLNFWGVKRVSCKKFLCYMKTGKEIKVEYNVIDLFFKYVSPYGIVLCCRVCQTFKSKKLNVLPQTSLGLPSMALDFSPQKKLNARMPVPLNHTLHRPQKFPLIIIIIIMIIVRFPFPFHSSTGSLTRSTPRLNREERRRKRRRRRTSTTLRMRRRRRVRRH